MPNQIPQGMLYLADEEPSKVAIKYFAWLAVMVLFIIMMVWFRDLHKKQRCSFDIYGGTSAKYLKRHHRSEYQ